MRESGKMENLMVKVKKVLLIEYFLLILTLANDIIGSIFYSDGQIFQGEWKDSQKNGQGKKSDFNCIFFIDSCIVLFAVIGKFFYNDGNRYEGEWKDGKKHGQGKKSNFN